MLWLFLTYNVKMEDNNMIKTTVKVDGMMAVFSFASSTGFSEMITVSPLLWEEVTLST